MSNGRSIFFENACISHHLTNSTNEFVCKFTDDVYIWLQTCDIKCGGNWMAALHSRCGTFKWFITCSNYITRQWVQFSNVKYKYHENSTGVLAKCSETPPGLSQVNPAISEPLSSQFGEILIPILVIDSVRAVGYKTWVSWLIHITIRFGLEKCSQYPNCVFQLSDTIEFAMVSILSSPQILRLK